MTDKTIDTIFKILNNPSLAKSVVGLTGRSFGTFITLPW